MSNSINYCQFLLVIKWYCAMIWKYMKFTCPTNRKSIHVWEKVEKVSEYGLNEINKRVLLLVPKLITI